MYSSKDAIYPSLLSGWRQENTRWNSHTIFYDEERRILGERSWKPNRAVTRIEDCKLGIKKNGNSMRLINHVHVPSTIQTYYFDRDAAEIKDVRGEWENLSYECQTDIWTGTVTKGSWWWHFQEKNPGPMILDASAAPGVIRKIGCPS